jgi:hypothetical protein
LGYDLDVITKNRPAHSQVAEFIQSHSKLFVEGELDPQHNLVVNRRVGEGHETIIELWGPDNAEPEDLENVVVQTIKPPYWLLRITVPAVQKDTLQLAEEIAAYIARSCEGVVYDPQAGAITWPKAKFENSPKSLGRERIRALALNWYLPSSQASISMARNFLRTVGSLCPEAFPSRFGLYHPLQGKMKSGEEQPFLDMVGSILQKGRADMLELRSRRPCFGGILWIPRTRGDRPQNIRMSDYVNLVLDFDGRVIESDPEWLERIVELFHQLASSLKAFYANAYVQRRVFASRGSLSYDGQSERYPRPMGRWVGIPSVPYWLSWFGPPYFLMVRDTLKGSTVSQFQDGILVRIGSKPQDLDQLQNSHLNLPPYLVSDMKLVSHQIKFPNGKTMLDDRWEASPAKVVPDIGSVAQS